MTMFTNLNSLRTSNPLFIPLSINMPKVNCSSNNPNLTLSSASTLFAHSVIQSRYFSSSNNNSKVVFVGKSISFWAGFAGGGGGGVVFSSCFVSSFAGGGDGVSYPLIIFFGISL